MTLDRLRVLGVAVLLAMSACSSSTSKGSDTTASSSTSTSSSIAGDTTTLAGDTTTSESVETTAAPVTSPPATNPPATNAPSGPKVQSATFNGPSACASPDVSIDLPPPSVSISWVATGADSVYIAIDNPNGPYESNLPLTGSIDGLPFGCPGSHTYYVVAVKGTQKDVEQKTFTAN